MEISALLIHWIHAPLGGLALAVGAIALIAKKGSTWHKRSGKVFFLAMLFSVLSSLLISLISEHQNAVFFVSAALVFTFLLWESAVRGIENIQIPLS